MNLAALPLSDLLEVGDATLSEARRTLAEAREALDRVLAKAEALPEIPVLRRVTLQPVDLNPEAWALPPEWCEDCAGSGTACGPNCPWAGNHRETCEVCDSCLGSGLRLADEHCRLCDHLGRLCSRHRIERCRCVECATSAAKEVR